MTEQEEKYIEAIKQKFPGSFIRTEEFRGDLTLEVRKGETTELMKFLKEFPDSSFDFLVDLTAVDFLKLGGEERYAIVYHLYSFSYNRRLCVKVWLPEEDLKVPTLMSIWKTVEWQEREVAELFGIIFEGHPDPRKLLLPDDYPGYPLRKDYPVQGEGYRSNFPNLRNK